MMYGRPQAQLFVLLINRVLMGSKEGTVLVPTVTASFTFKRRNSVGANSNSIMYRRSHWAALGDTSHDT